jgi:hypothetical protein
MEKRGGEINTNLNSNITNEKKGIEFLQILRLSFPSTERSIGNECGPGSFYFFGGHKKVRTYIGKVEEVVAGLDSNNWKIRNIY